MNIDWYITVEVGVVRGADVVMREWVVHILVNYAMLFFDDVEPLRRHHQSETSQWHLARRRPEFLHQLMRLHPRANVPIMILQILQLRVLIKPHLYLDDILGYFLIDTKEFHQFGFLQESVVTRIVDFEYGRQLGSFTQQTVEFPKLFEVEYVLSALKLRFRVGQIKQSLHLNHGSQQKGYIEKKTWNM